MLSEGTPDDHVSVQVVNLAAFEQIHESFSRILGPEINTLAYPDWRASQQREVSELLIRRDTRLAVADIEDQIVGFVIVELNSETLVGELQIIAVHPDFRRQGIGARLNDRALSVMRDAGMRLANLATGGDEAHAAARRSYERAGYVALPLVRYYKPL